MKLSDLHATAIIRMVLGERGLLKEEEELAKVLKSRLTKKERQVLDVMATGTDIDAFLPQINADRARFDAIAAAAVKKLKNEAVHRDFYHMVTPQAQS